MRRVFAIIVTLVLSTEALPCSCDVGTIDERFENASAVFRIRVTGTELRATSELDLSGVKAEEEIGEDKIAQFLEEIPKYVQVSFEMIEALNGQSSIPEHLMEMPFSPGNCGLGLMAGVEYVIFLAGDFLEFATFCTGSFGFFNAEGTDVKPDLDRLRELANILSSGQKSALRERERMPSNKGLQTDKGKLSCLLHSQKPRQLAFAAELGRYTT